MNKKQAIAKAKRLKKLTNESHHVFKNLSGFEVVSDDFFHTAIGFLIFSS